MAQAVEGGFNLLPDKLLIHQDRVTYAADTGAVNAYLIALPKTLVAYTTGLRVVMKTANANTGASTINVDSLGVKNIKRANGSALEANDIAAGQMVMLGYDGTNFQVLNGAGANADVSIHAALVATHGATGAIVGTTNAQTLINKTLTAAALAGTTDLSGGQIKFPTSQAASADPNTLDDYEEGTFVPIFTSAVAPTGVAYSAQIGSYVKIGKVVTFKLRVTLSSKGSGGSGDAYISNLPFAAANDGLPASCGVAFDLLDFGAGFTALVASVQPNALHCTLPQLGDNIVSANLQWSGVANTSDFQIFGSYMV